MSPIWRGIFAGLLVLGAHQEAQAQESPKPPVPPSNPYAGQDWFAALQFGTGPQPDSPQRDALNKMGGYGSDWRFWWGLQGAYEVGQLSERTRILLGAYAGMTSTRDEGATAERTRIIYGESVPQLKEDARWVGLQLSLSLALLPVYLRITPKFGVGFVRQYFDGPTRFTSAPGYGGELAIQLEKVPIGFALGVMRATITPSGVLTNETNPGGFYFAIQGALHRGIFQLSKALLVGGVGALAQGFRGLRPPRRDRDHGPPLAASPLQRAEHGLQAHRRGQARAGADRGYARGPAWPWPREP